MHAFVFTMFMGFLGEHLLVCFQCCPGNCVSAVSQSCHPARSFTHYPSRFMVFSISTRHCQLMSVLRPT
jgi:hypothetical protein